MKLKHVFLFHLIIEVSFGIGCLLLPNFFVGLFGRSLDEVGRLMTQLGGCWLVGIASVMWLTRGITDAKTIRALATAFFIMSAVSLIVIILGQVNHVLNVLGWMPATVTALLVLGYGYFLFIKPEAA
jgi:hypothetical protein